MAWLKEQLQRLGITYLEVEQRLGPLTDREAHHVARMLCGLEPGVALETLEREGKTWIRSKLIKR